MNRFEWHPGAGIDALALARLRANLPRPLQPMGEAWFMGQERRLFHELHGDLDALSVPRLQAPLEEIASGTSSFGPRDEWREWYHHLLGKLLPRCHDAYVTPLLELLVTGFVALHPNGIHRPPYREFADDVLVTLGRAMMEPGCWHGRDIAVGRVLHRGNDNPARVWGWSDASGDFAASMFFCLKYLPCALVRGWFSSVLAIECAHWRAQVMVWLVGSRGLLEGQLHWPSQLAREASPRVGWDWSHCLDAELATRDDAGATAVASALPQASRDHVLEVARAFFTDDVLLDWLDAISRVPYLEAELGAAPASFEAMYMRRDT